MINLNVQSVNENSRNIPETKLVHEYILSETEVLNILFDPIRGASAKLFSEGKVLNIAFPDIKGIRSDSQFNHKVLVACLNDTYAQIRRFSDGSIGVVINPRMRGGGGGHSTHCQSTQHYTSPPPPRSVHVNYNAGFPIREVQSVPQIAGNYVNQAGGVIGQSNFTVTFQTYDAGAHPDVIIKVWKKDYHQAKIAQLQASKNVLLVSQNAKIAEKQPLLASKANIQAMENSVKTNNELRNKCMLDWVAKNSEILALTQQQVDSDARHHEFAEQIRIIESPNIRSLVDLLAIANQLGINLIRPEQITLLQHVAKDSAKEKLVCLTPSSEGIIGVTRIALSDVLAETKKAQGQEIVGLLGPTGTGKSTAVNYFCGRSMKAVEDDLGDRVVVANPSDEVAKIGHGGSETLFTQVYDSPAAGFKFADCGGFFDTRGVSTNFAIAGSLKQTFEAAQGVKLLLCYDSNIMMAERAIHFKTYIELALDTLKNFKEHGQSVALMFTKPRLRQNGEMFSKADAIRNITALYNDAPEGSKQKDMYKFLLRDNGDYICVCDPLANDKRNDIYALLNKMKPITNTKESFQLACSADSHVALFEAMQKTTIVANDLFRQYEAAKLLLDENSAKLLESKEKVEALRTQQTTLEQTISRQETFLTTNSSQKVSASLIELEQQIAALQTQIVAIDNEIKPLDTTDFVVYRNIGGGWTVT